MHFNVKLRKSMHIHVLSRTSYSFTCIFALVHADYTGLHVFVRTFHTFIRTFVLSYAHSSYLYTHNAYSHRCLHILTRWCTHIRSLTWRLGLSCIYLYIMLHFHVHIYILIRVFSYMLHIFIHVCTLLHTHMLISVL
jgi:hypothetical protein